MADSDWMTVAEAVDAIYQAAFGATAGAAYQATLANPPATAITIPNAQFYIRKLPWNLNVTHPGCFLVPVPEKLMPATNKSDDWGHGIQVYLTQVSNRSLTSDHDDLHFLRELAIGQFLCQRIASLSAYYVEVEPQGILEPGAFAANIDRTTFVLRCTKRKTRPTQATP